MSKALRFLLTVLAVMTSGISLEAQQNELRSLAESLAQEIVASGKKSIAVVDFTDLQGNPTELGRFLAEEFSVALARTHKGFEVIDRTHLKAILTEHKLSATGLIDPSTAKKLGQIVGADALLTGSMTPFSESVHITVKVLATDTARILAADNAEIPKTKTITELLGAAIISPDGRPVLRRTDEPPPNEPPTQTSSRPSNQVVVVQEFLYELVGCSGLANSVKCSLRITNRGPDRELIHFCGESSHAIDNFGNETVGGVCTIANKGNGVVSIPMITGITVQASIVLPNVSASASSLARFNINGEWDSNQGRAYLTVAFRNVPIVR